MSSEIAQEPRINSPAFPMQPIVLTSPEKAQANNSKQSRGQGFLSTFAVLLAGWLIGNLILFSILGVGAVALTSSTGLVKVPFLTSYFFGDKKITAKEIDIYSLHNAEEKIKKIQELSSGETLNSLVFYEDEINALLVNKTQKDPNFPIVWENLSLQSNEFIFNGALSSTNAPVIIKGKIVTQGLSGEIEIVEAKYGKITIPNFLAANIVESQLSIIGLSLNGNKIPAKAIELSPGLLKLIKVTNSQ